MEWENQLVHGGVGYAFCSQQCRERFALTPRLYVGRHGVLAPKQKGVAVIKRRCIALGAPLPQARFVELERALLAMMGVIAVRPISELVKRRHEPQWTDGGTRRGVEIKATEICYDLLQATAMQVERRIVDLNATLNGGWGEKLRRDFIHYLEQCELDDLAVRNMDPVQFGARAHRAAPGYYSGAGPRTGHGTRDLTR